MTKQCKVEDAQYAHKNDKSTNWDLFALCQDDFTERLIMSQDAYDRYKAAAECIHEFKKKAIAYHIIWTLIDWQEKGIL